MYRIFLLALIGLFSLSLAPAQAQNILTKGVFFIDSNNNGLPDPGEGTLVGQRMWVVCDFGFDGLPYTGDDILADELGVAQNGSFQATRGINQCYISLPDKILSDPPAYPRPSGYEPTIMTSGGNRLRKVATYTFNNIANEQQETSWVTDLYTVVRGQATTVNIGLRLIGSGPAQPYKNYAPLLIR